MRKNRFAILVVALTTLTAVLSAAEIVYMIETGKPPLGLVGPAILCCCGGLLVVISVKMMQREARKLVVLGVDQRQDQV
jgi:hypothetical protein